MAILTCPGCDRGGLRVPDGRRGKVTCPFCGAEWFHPPTVELSEVEFRCAKSGARFVLQMSRRSPLHKFVIQGIKDAPADPKHGFDSDTIHASGGSASHLPPAKSRNLLGRLFGKPMGLSTSRSSAADTSDSIVHSTAGTAQHDATEYNWESFLCPYCDASSFIKCSGGHLACDGTVQIRNGRRFHQCYCGSAGFIEGAIKSIEANQHTFTAEPNVSSFSENEAAATELTKTNRKTSLSVNTDEASETPKLPLSSPPPRSR